MTISTIPLRFSQKKIPWNILKALFTCSIFTGQNIFNKYSIYYIKNNHNKSGIVLLVVAGDADRVSEQGLVDDLERGAALVGGLGDDNNNLRNL